jgi:N-acetylglucosaminyldiphosphoundecaprenol N-acetyl-beta-D-mannosaminyltransferase
VLSLIDEYVRSGQPHHVMTPNPEYVMAARGNPELRRALERADLAPADGVGIRWAGALLHQPIREVVPGSEIVERIAEGAAARRDRWFLLGGEPGVAEAVSRQLTSRFPGLAIAGAYSGTSDPSGDGAACAAIEAVAPVHVLLVAFGCPAQDLWIERNQQRLRIPVAIGVGGTFNFIAGRSRRPPRVVKRLNLIWLFRLLTEPWRLRRQWRLVPFALLVAGEAVSLRLCARQG